MAYPPKVDSATVRAVLAEGALNHHTLEQMAVRLGYSRERMRQLAKEHGYEMAHTIRPVQGDTREWALR